jgi:molybdenum cofactor sulfurtransferase
MYSTSLIRDYKNTLITNVFGNPHSGNPSSQHSSNCVEKARADVLKFFNAKPEEYDVVFTANATAAMKMVADGFVGDLLSAFGSWQQRQSKWMMQQLKHG